jgi:acid stress-induced BolA-like protein IbaG/YrbA
MFASDVSWLECQQHVRLPIKNHIQSLSIHAAKADAYC